MDFAKKLDLIVAKNNSLLCVGLDPDPFQGVSFKGSQSLFKFNKRIIDQTASFVCAYKPNIAFYEAAGLEGLQALKETIAYLKKNFAYIPIVLDAKRADIPNTARMYAKSAFEYWQADAVTVYPYLGLDSLKPFLSYQDKLVFLLIKTSNPDAGTFQDLPTEGMPYFLKMAQIIKKWPNKNIGIFIGATYPKELAQVRAIFPNNIFLSAGVGAQKGSVEKSVRAGLDKSSRGIIFNASRSIIYARDPQKAAEKLRDEINKYR